MTRSARSPHQRRSKRSSPARNEQYNARGITDTRADIRSLEWATERIAIVHVRWPYLDAQGKEKREEASTYVLERDEAGDFRFYVAVLRGASRPS